MTAILNLTAESIRNPTRTGQAQIEAMMLWPEDEKARDVFLMASLTEHRIRHLPELSPEELEQVRTHLLLDLPRIKDLQTQIADRVAHGEIAGMLTLRSSVGVDFFGAKSLTSQQEEISRNLKPDFQIEPRTMNNRTGPLYKFRPVAHLWAAYALYVMNGRRAFPCKVADIPDFLGTAEAVRLKAETTRLPRSNSTVMREGEAILLPADVRAALPPVNFKLATSPETRH
jgi:hypothetical protein